ncbi:GSCOCG00008630001-RA-CDS [Cotesia congregata]|nr:GSCOCG00008630001-RA-CDS [Cotesia congregata]
MKYHLVVGVLIVLTLFLDETFAGRGGGSSNTRRKSKSSSRNHPDNRRSPSPEVRRFSPQNSQFRPVSPEASHSRAAPAPTSSSSSSSSVPQPGNSANPRPGTSRTTIENRNLNIQNTAKEFAIKQSRSVDGRSNNRINGPPTERPPPTLEELHNNPTHSRFSPKDRHRPPPVKNPQANPSPLPSYEFNQIHLARPSRIRQTTNPRAEAEANSVPGPSGSQPTAPAALVQAGRAPVPGSRAADKAI